jgi:hypothetical protein
MSGYLPVQYPASFAKRKKLRLLLAIAALAVSVAALDLGSRAGSLINHVLFVIRIGGSVTPEALAYAHRWAWIALGTTVVAIRLALLALLIPTGKRGVAVIVISVVALLFSGLSAVPEFRSLGTN